jgi:uncharacterized protein YerC
MIKENDTITQIKKITGLSTAQINAIKPLRNIVIKKK